MHKVRLISKYDGETPEAKELLKNIRTVGDELPVVGKIYEVDRYSLRFDYTQKDKDRKYYKLLGLNYDAYSADLFFDSRLFEEISDEYVPNHVNDDGDLCMVYSMNIEAIFTHPKKIEVYLN